MTLVNARAALEAAIKTSLKENQPRVTVVFDNTPFTTPGRTKKYVLVSIDFDNSTYQPQGAAQTYYSGSVTCGIMTPKDTGTAESSAVSQAVIDGLISVNAPTYEDTYSVSPRVSEISGPSFVNNENNSHYLSTVNCSFTANA
mgnify:CR=1 FL=1